MATPETKKHKSFYMSVAVLVVSVVLALLLVFFALIRSAFVSIYEDNYSRRVLEINAYFALQVDGDKVEEYIKTLTRDEYYYQLTGKLYELKRVFEVDSLYIMADTGLPDEFLCIFAADSSESTYDNSFFGATEPKNIYPGGQEVLETRLPFSNARYYYDEEYGHLYYAYQPIANSRGRVVAFLGTDIDATPMMETIRRFEINLIVFSAVTFVVLFVFIIFYGRRSLSRPILRMTEDIQRLAQGELDIEFSPALLGRKDEFGLIYRAFRDVTEIVTTLIRSMNDVTSRVSRGLLDARIHDAQLYRGSYARFVAGANGMLDSNRQLLDMMPNAVVFYDGDGRRLYHNTPATASYAIRTGDDGTPGESDSRQVELLLQNEAVIADLQRLLQDSGEDTFTGNMAVLDEGGAIRHFNAFLIRTGTQGGVCAVFTDVTEYVDMSERAEASNRAKSEFLSRMSHEIRTPMNAIIGMTEIAKRQTADPPVAAALSTIEASARHLLTIINDILDISKIDYGNFELSHEPFSLRALFHEVARILERQAAERDLTLNLTVNGFEEDPWLLGDVVRIRQVVINLVSNAIKFSREGDAVDLEVSQLPALRENHTCLLCAVRDYGIGISPENQQKIFEAFEQGDRSVARIYGGTGLGLPISNKIVELMGGESIRLQSREGEGSTFSFVLELENAPPTQRKAAPAPLDSGVPDLSGKRILVVDDIEINREIALSLLADTGAALEGADDGSSAVERFLAAPEGHYSLILMDIQMRRMDGHAATRAIRASGRGDAGSVKIVGMSANAFAADIDQAMEAGMDSYITKPVDYDEMIRTITQLTGGDR